MKALPVLLLALALSVCGVKVTEDPAVVPTQAGPTLTASPAPPTSQVPAPTLPLPSGVYTVTGALGYVDTFRVDPGLENPTPQEGESVTLRARLYKNGVRVGGMPIRVEWNQEGTLQRCEIMPFYLAGCTIEVQDFALGLYVPVTVTIGYQGMEFIGYTGFWPQQNVGPLPTLPAPGR